MSDPELRITEIFYSLQGEVRTAGIPTVFVRLTGCPLRCHYCDTAYAFTGGKKYTTAQILDAVDSYSVQHVTVTGGEPLAQAGCHVLLAHLCDKGYEVSLETSGALDISQVDERVSRVVDIKTPGSGEQHRNLLSNFDYLTRNDQLKFVICNRADFDWAKAFIEEHALQGRCEIWFSPSHEELPAPELAQWILDERLDVRFQIQLHKILWHNEPGR